MFVVGEYYYQVLETGSEFCTEVLGPMYWSCAELTLNSTYFDKQVVKDASSLWYSFPGEFAGLISIYDIKLINRSINRGYL